jgi:hypothetical protein
MTKESFMKKTVASLAILASLSTANALVGPGDSTSRTPNPKPRPTPVKACLNTYQMADGSVVAGECDASEQNKIYGVEILENGCAEEQVAVSFVGVTVRTCPTYVQL